MIRRSALLAAVLLLAPLAARADGNDGAPDDVLEFGAINTFASERLAKAACGSDAVVWADRYAGYYFFPREPQYGHTAMGAYACWHNAKHANYWSSSPMSSIGDGHGPGRVFPERFPPPTPPGS